MKLVARIGEETIPIEIDRLGNGYLLKIGERMMAVDFVSTNSFLSSIRIGDGLQFLVGHHRDGNRHEISFGSRTVAVEIHDPLALRGRSREDSVSGSGVVKAAMPGRVVKVLVEKGQTVAKGAPLLILEAMKMENELTAPRDGSVAALLVEPGQTVDSGTELIRIE